MKKILIVGILAMLYTPVFSQSIYKGLEYGMSKTQAIDAFKENREEYVTVDLGNNFLYRIYQQNFIYENDSLVGVLLSPKGMALGMGHDLTTNYLEYTRGFFEQLGYETILENEYWNAPVNYSKSASKWGLILANPEKTKVVQMYPNNYQLSGKTVYSVILKVWHYSTWIGYYETAQTDRIEKAAKSGF